MGPQQSITLMGTQVTGPQPPSAAAIVSNTEARVKPSRLKAASGATAIIAASKPYSIAVAPLSSRRKPLNDRLLSFPPKSSPDGPRQGCRPLKAAAFLIPLLLLAACCPAPPKADPEADRAAIRQVVADMEAAWNRGDFAAYMAAFKKPDVVFVSKGRVQKDWQATLDHYVRDYGGDPKRRGRVHFWDLRIDLLSPDAAMLTGRYRLEGGGQPQDGINTRLFRKVGGRWVIAMNHVSSRDPAPPPPPPPVRRR
jgi:uncharacterized protein (TIGR02246 family)